MPKISVISCSIRPEGLEITRQSLLAQTFTDFEWIVDINWTGEHDLNAAYNRCIRRSSGELVVSLQDYISIKPDALQKLWDAYQKHPKAFITCPVGKQHPQDISGEIRWDWRHSPDSIIDWRMWEIDFGACPKSALYEIGGFDEELDGFWSCDNVNVGCRAELAGYEFLCLRDVEGIAVDHDAFIEHPFRKDYKPVFNQMRIEEFRDGLRIDYLTLTN